MFIYFTLLDIGVEQEKFIKVYNYHRKKMLHTAFQVLGNLQDAEDAVHDAFLGIARHMNAIENVEDYRTAVYVTKAARNSALKILRNRRCKVVPLEDTCESIPDTTDYSKAVCEKEEVRKVLDTIYKMDEKYRDILFFHYVSGMSTPEISDLLCIKHNTVKSRLRRGRKMLLDSLKEDFSYEK